MDLDQGKYKTIYFILAFEVMGHCEPQLPTYDESNLYFRTTKAKYILLVYACNKMP